MTLKIFHNANLIQNEYQRYISSNGFIDKMISFEDFKQRSLLIDDKIFPDPDTRVLLLREAADFEGFEKLKFKLDFISFLESSSYIFSFLQECADEFVDLKKLKSSDPYAEFEERIDILRELKKRYKKLLDKKGYGDGIFTPKEYRLNLSFIKSFQKIIFYQEDYISSFELKLLDEASKTVSVFIKIKIDDFNSKVASKYEGLGIFLEKGYEYEINLSSKKILKKTPLEKKPKEYEVFEASNALTQIAYMKKKVYDFIKSSIKPENIVVISNSEDFFKLLHLFDEEKNFYFINNFTFENSQIYKKLQSVYDYFSQKNFESLHRITRLGYQEEKIKKSFEAVWEKKIPKESLKNLFEEFKSSDQKENLIYEEELYKFLRLSNYLSNYPFNKIFHLFIQRLKKRKTDDQRGGKIAVMKLLDAKGLSFEGVIAVDFNEGKTFTTPSNDFFLSSSLRHKVGLLSSKDIQNIQKSQYLRLFQNAKQSAVSYIKSDLHRPSKFLYELTDIKKNEMDEDKLNEILFNSTPQKERFLLHDLKIEYDFRNTVLSPTKLKTFLDCKRKYYLKYIRALEDFQIPKDEMDEREIGIILHKALNRLYKKEIFFDEKKLLKNLKEIVYEETEDKGLLKLSADIWLSKMESFAKKEVERFKEGFRIRFLEEEFKIIYNGFKFRGKIDRVDEKEGKLFIIDYKSGKIPKSTKNSLPKTTDFQLPIYYRLLENKAEIEKLFYCDLNSGEWIEDPFFDEKLALFDQKLQNLKEREINFTKTEDFSKCRYCPYIILCNRE